MKEFNYYFRKLKYLTSNFKYRIKGCTIGRYFMVGKSVNIDTRGFTAGDCIYIGQYSYIGPFVHLGNFCILSDCVNFIGGDHVFDKETVPVILSGRPDKVILTTVGDDVWIGHGVTVIRGVQIGEGSIVGSNSVVTKNVEPYTVVAGNPAKKIKMRFSLEMQQRHSDFLKSYREGRLILMHDRKPIFRQI